VSVLSPTMKHHRLDMNVQNNVVQLLCKLLNSAGAVASFQKADGFPQVLEILKVHRKNRRVVQYTLTALNKVMLDLARTEELVNADVINRTMKCMKKHIESGECRSLALTVLTTIARFNPVSIGPILDSWDKHLSASPEELPLDVKTTVAILKLEQYTHYGGGSALEAFNSMLEFERDPIVVKNALHCMRSKAWDPQKRLEFKEIPDFVKGVSRVCRTHNRNREVLLAGVEMCKVSMERGMMGPDDPKFEEFADVAVQILENNICSNGFWKPVHWLLVLDTIKLVARRPIGMKVLNRKCLRSQLLDKIDSGGEELRAMTTDVVNILNVPL